jgi:alanine dehydrogenase
MTILLDDEAVRSVFDWDLAVAALRDAYGADPAEARFPARRMARGEHGWLRTLSGVPAGSGPMGLKVIAAAPAARQASYLIPLFDQRTAEFLALLDGHSITGFRTAATSALAADALALPGALDLAVIGSGFEARNHVRALAAIREIKTVRVFSPRPASRARFVAELAGLAAPVLASDSAEEAVGDATVVVCAARSRDESPTLRGMWLRPGMTVVSVGSTLPEQRELDTEAIGRADVVVCDVVAEVLADTGDLIAARAAGLDPGARAVALADLIAGRHPGRTGERQILLYKSVGSALQDLAIAGLCVRAAERRGLGVRLPIDIRPVRK